MQIIRPWLLIRKYRCRSEYSAPRPFEPARRRKAETQSGHPIRGQADLQALAPVLRENRTWSFEKPQTYVASEEGIFVLSGHHINEHAHAAGGRPALWPPARRCWRSSPTGRGRSPR
jgi:hypothetical protein